MVAADLRTASNCNCPSRKFPCRHALDLLVSSDGVHGCPQQNCVKP
ncbi:SWIM zinc finger family protein [Deinococcus radiophilus]|nr:SWIM zinc finger family protein [Deinococcus radiophilus]UFA51909.1 SWIM zinc finger family protein [Deinococcus radiophilus]